MRTFAGSCGSILLNAGANTSCDRCSGWFKSHNLESKTDHTKTRNVPETKLDSIRTRRTKIESEMNKKFKRILKNFLFADGLRATMRIANCKLEMVEWCTTGGRIAVFSVKKLTQQRGRRDEEIQNESEQLKRVLQDSKTDALYRKRLSQKRPEKRLTSWQRRSMSHNGARSVNGHLFCCRKLFARIIAKQITAITIITAHCPPLAAYTRHKLEDRMWLKSPQCELATWTHKSRTPNLQFGLTTWTYNSHLQIRALTTRALTTPTCERRAVRSKFANLK